MDIFNIGHVANSAISSVLLFLSASVSEIMGKILSGIAGVFNDVLQYQAANFVDVTIVKNSWATFRDFTNMFFILILIIIAFGTIFDVSRYNWKGLMARFLIVALLINFSFAICVYVVQVSSTLSGVMLGQFSDITESLGGGFGLNKLGGGFWVTADAEKVAMSVIISAVGQIVISSIALLSLAIAAIFSFVRIPMLWALIILSPLAWLAAILPATRHFYEKWQKNFLGWTFFMPIYLFALMMGMVILANRADLQTVTQMSGGAGFARIGSFFGFAFQDIFFYIFTVLFLLGGLAGSLKVSFFAGTSAGKALGAVHGGVTDWAARRTRLTALKVAGKEKIAEVQEKGLPGRFRMLYGGQRAEELRTARMRERLGIAGQEGAYERTLREQRRKDTDVSYKNYQDQNLTQADIVRLLASEKDQSKILALRKINAEKGWVPRGANGRKEIENTVEILGENTREGQEYIAALVRNNFKDVAGSSLEMRDFVNTITSTALKRAALKVMAQRGDLGELNDEKLFLATRDLYSTESKQEQDAIDAALMKNFDRLDEKTVDVLLNSGKMNEDQTLDLYERRVEKDWIPAGAAYEGEIQKVLSRLGGEQSQRGQKYISTLIRNDFMNRMGSQAEKEAFIKNKTIPEILHNAGVEVMAKNNDLISDDLVKMGLDSLAGQVKEKRDRIYEYLKKNIKNVKGHLTKTDRERFMFDVGNSDEMRKLQAEQMLDDGEINTYKKYSTAEELFGGENETLSRAALSRIAKEQEVIHAETLWRKERAATTGNKFYLNSTFTGTTADRALLKAELDSKFVKMEAAKVAGLNKESWLLPEFEQALQKKVSDLQAIDPGRKTAKGKRIHGAGERFKDSLQRLTSGSPEKLGILSRITIP